MLFLHIFVLDTAQLIVELRTGTVVVAYLRQDIDLSVRILLRRKLRGQAFEDQLYLLPVDEVIQRAGVQGFTARKVKKCSGGQRQRLRFALALLTDPQLLILDEPTAGLDATARKDFWATMHAEARRGRTIVFATHYLREADDYADRVVLMAQGRVIADGSVADMTADMPRQLSAQWISDLDPYVWADTIGAGAEGLHYDATTQRIHLTTAETDRIAAQLLSAGLIRHLTISQPGVEEAFFDLTQDHRSQETAS